MDDREIPHHSVLRDEVLHLFEGKRIETYIDGTLGAGGHAKAVLTAHPEIRKCIGIDQDPDAMLIARKALKEWEGKIHFWQSNFYEALAQLHKDRVKVDAILLDLGVSSMQLDRPEKGFSFSVDGPLDMRMNPEAPLTAEEVVNGWSEEALGRIFRDYGEEKRWRAAARAIARAREAEPIKSTRKLVEILLPVIPKKKGKSIHPATLIFQAIRICVNRELEVLEKALPLCLDILHPGGIIAVISFHSLEDRIVKQFFHYCASDKVETSGIGGVFLDKIPTVRVLTRKPLVATEREINENPRSRSAKLRAVEKLALPS